MISVCMATHNGEKYIKEQIDSILPQLSFDDELIISDDASTDKTIEFIQQLNDPRIKLIYHTPVKGSPFLKATKNFENALRCAKGEYIFLADQDDVWKANKVEVLVDNLRKYSCVKHRYSLLPNCIKKDNLWKKQRRTFIGNILYLPYHGCCMALRRDLLEKVLPIPQGIFMHDAWIGLLAFMNRSYQVIDEELIYYRIHGDNVSRGVSNSIMFKIKYRLILASKLIIRYFSK